MAALSNTNSGSGKQSGAGDNVSYHRHYTYHLCNLVTNTCKPVKVSANGLKRANNTTKHAAVASKCESGQIP